MNGNGHSPVEKESDDYQQLSAADEERRNKLHSVILSSEV